MAVQAIFRDCLAHVHPPVAHPAQSVHRSVVAMAILLVEIPRERALALSLALRHDEAPRPKATANQGVTLEQAVGRKVVHNVSSRRRCMAP